MPKIYKNLYEDYFASTDFKLSGATQTMWDHQKKVTVGINNREFTMDNTRGLRSQGAITAAKKYQVERNKETSGMYAEFMAESDKYQEKIDTMYQAMDTETSLFDSLQSELDSSKEKMQTNQTVSSLGAYSAAAKKQMQETNRVINELKGVKAPQQVALDMSFTDPLTGRTVGQEDVFEMADIDIAGNVDAMVRRDFSEKTTQIIQDLTKTIEKDTGFSYDQMTNDDFNSSMHKFLDDAREVFVKNYTGDPNAAGRQFNSGYYDHITWKDSGYTVGQLREFENVNRQYHGLQNFAESRALAEMTEATEGFKAGDAIATGSQIYMSADRDAVLDQIISDTTTRYETSQLKDKAALSKEFDRRKALAVSQGADAARRNELNKARAESVRVKTRQYEQLLAEQRKEYESTLASAGAVENESGSVSFKDLRPQ